jgi:hypothetical protein
MDVPASIKNIEYCCLVRFTTILIAALPEEHNAEPFRDLVVPDIVSANELAALEAPLMSLASTALLDVATASSSLAAAASEFPAFHLHTTPVVAEKPERLITEINKVGCELSTVCFKTKMLIDYDCFVDFLKINESTYWQIYWIRIIENNTEHSASFNVITICMAKNYNIYYRGTVRQLHDKI